TAMATTDIGPQAPPTHRLIGGDWRKPAAALKPGFPAFLSSAQPDTRLPAALPSTGRRAALARWLTRPDHPLTARVIVNRLWQHHFGRGIVGTPNDFGVRGEKPTHPELLDWLACELVSPSVRPRHLSDAALPPAWSLKHIHRLIVTSATYRQSAIAEHGAKLDPDNKLLWKMNRRRLE